MSYNHSVKVIMHGSLRDICPDVQMSGFSVAEIINGLCKQTKAFNITAGQERHSLSVEGFDTKDSLYAPIPNDTKELHVFPAMYGSGGLFQVIIGIVLIAVAIWLGPAAWPILSPFLMKVGITLVIGGLLEMISPAPTMNPGSNAASLGSNYLAATQNTVKIGTRIPLLYGLCMAYGQYLSFNIDAKDIAL